MLLKKKEINKKKINLNKKIYYLLFAFKYKKQDNLTTRLIENHVSCNYVSSVLFNITIDTIYWQIGLLQILTKFPSVNFH